MIDPFAMKRFSKADPRRLAFTALARANDMLAAKRFDHYALPITDEGELNDAATTLIEDTDVDQRQMDVLSRHFLTLQARLPGDSVEIGAYRGVTTRRLAELAPTRTVYAVDPFMGYGGSDEDFAIFRERTGGVPNIVHIRKPSGEGARELADKPVSFVFVDAVHDYANVLFDGTSWFNILRPGGLIAFHDVDEIAFAGTRRAVSEIARRATLESHVPGLIILHKPVS